MTEISAPLKILKPSEPPAQVIEEDKKAWKEKHKVIYDAFLDQLEKYEDLDKRTLDNYKDIFNNVKPEDIKLLSKKNFLEFLLSVLEKIRAQGLANKENLTDNEIKQVVDDCVSDIRDTEAKDSSIKLLGWPFGIKIDPKNISGSFMSWLRKYIPFLGEGEKQEDEPPLSDEEMVITFLRKIFLPAFVSIASILIFGPTTFAIVAAAIGAMFAIKGGVEVLFSNNKPGTLYNPDTQKEKEKEWDNEISSGISKILETPVKGAKKGNQSDVIGEEQLVQAGNGEQQPTALEQVSVGQLDKSTDKSF
ncbi:hypothetical protein [Wolbachia endosymbiont of Cantharis cryptica]|uniref:hypothetical protein n=1 Tax=Wolbachia endosymbiont of Cantharis cryptica TaxID=3066132 RepID=UPI00376EFE5C